MASGTTQRRCTTHLTAQHQCLRGQCDCFQTRRTHFVHGRAHRLLRQASKNGRLSGGRLAQTSRTHIPHVHFVHLIANDAGSLDRRAHSNAAQFRCRQRRQRALETADWCSHRTHNHHIIQCYRFFICMQTTVQLTQSDVCLKKKKTKNGENKCDQNNDDKISRRRKYSISLSKKKTLSHFTYFA